jgi:phosphoglycolate phosphatase-like HAD superfamily hydrolase
MIKAIFYDFDGVIKESTDIKSKAFYDLYIEFGEDIAQQVEQYHIEHGGVSRFEKIRYWHKTHLGINITDNELQLWAQKFSDLVLKKVVESPYVKGALNTIQKLGDEYQQYIITGTPQNEIEQICIQLEITSLFKQICGSPTNKIKWCSQLIPEIGLSNKEIVFIGDATTDYDAAIHHNLHFVLREHEENEALFANKSVIKIKDLLSLESVIKKIN